jgi:hypothetical protein
MRTARKYFAMNGSDVAVICLFNALEARHGCVRREAAIEL